MKKDYGMIAYEIWRTNEHKTYQDKKDAARQLAAEIRKDRTVTKDELENMKYDLLTLAEHTGTKKEFRAAGII